MKHCLSVPQWSRESLQETFSFGQPFTCLFLQAIDFTSIHLYPDFWASSNLTFQLQFSAQYINGHMAESAALQKPLIISEFGKLPPLADRNTYLRSVYGVAASSAASSGPLAGENTNRFH